MGLLVDGQWQDRWYDTDSTGGRFERSEAAFRNWVTADGEPGPTGRGGFKAEPGRYHLYIAYACPWAHRAVIYRRLKGLQSMIGLSVVNPLMGEHGWTFRPGYKVTGDPILKAEFLHQLYTHAKADYSGRVTVPVLWDCQEQTIVSNESADIIRMFNSVFDHLGARPIDFYPHPLRGRIDELNERIYGTVNNGVYKAGFATTQEAYEEAVIALFETLDELDQRLADQRYLCGAEVTEADWRLFTTLVRFDAVYVGHFKCNLRRIEDYRHLSNYLRDLFQVPGVSETVELRAIKLHYYASHKTINPHAIVPLGPALDFHRAHDRHRFGD